MNKMAAFCRDAATARTCGARIKTWRILPFQLLPLLSSFVLACFSVHSAEPSLKPDFASGQLIDQPTGFFHTKKITVRW